MKQALIPETFDEFRSVDFWDGFFKTRGHKAFEWYGDWRQLKPHLTRDCKHEHEILVVGCGNSDLSAHLYDHGCHQITNLDFSKLVIGDMMRKNIRQRPKMKWKIGDMTDLKFPDASFQVVIDKGGLDALMGEDSADGTASGQALLAGVSRVLSPGGMYMCVTLAQSHVLRLVLDTFKRGWILDLSPVPPSPDMARSELQPILIKAEKVAPGAQSGRSNICSVQRAPKAPNAEQLDEICQILEAAASTAAVEADSAKKEKEGVEDDFEELQPGSRWCYSLPYRPGRADTSNPRFRAVVLDVADVAADGALTQCCVFLVPQGRESEWLFGSEEGQWQVARQCRAKRVILVTLSRMHSFSDSHAVQSEISPLVEILAPLEMRGVRDAIPIMTTQEGVGRRRVVEEAQSSVSGRIVVEDVAIEEGQEFTYARRMVFVGNSNLIQSEARLKACGGPPLSKTALRKGRFPELEIDHALLGMEYHSHIIAGIVSGSCLGSAQGTGYSALVIGLGGGGLPIFLNRHLKLQTEAVELDEEVIRLARKHFGCQPSQSLQVKPGDGLEAVEEHNGRAAEELNVLIVDAGSSDASLAMSCPPAPFLKTAFLKAAHRALKPSGLLVVNCVTRSDTAFQEAYKKVEAIFPEVRFSEVDDDVNRLLFASKSCPGQRQSTDTLQGCLTSALIGTMSSRQVDLLAEDLSGFELKSLE